MENEIHTSNHAFIISCKRIFISTMEMKYINAFSRFEIKFTLKNIFYSF